LPLFFHGSFPRGPLSEFHIPGLLLGFHGGLASDNLGGLCGGQSSSVLSFNVAVPLSDTGIAGHPDRVPRRAPLDSGRGSNWTPPPPRRCSVSSR
jgi:hypothetical protein